MSEVRVNLVSDLLGTGPADLLKQWAARSYVMATDNGTLAIISSGNVSSVIDGGGGDTTFNTTSAFADANFCITGTCDEAGASPATAKRIFSTYARTVSSYRTLSANAGGSFDDPLKWNVVVTGDLA